MITTRNRKAKKLDGFPTSIMSLRGIVGAFDFKIPLASILSQSSSCKSFTLPEGTDAQPDYAQVRADSLPTNNDNVAPVFGLSLLQDKAGIKNGISDLGQSGVFAPKQKSRITNPVS